ncbi:hypothetical protein ABE79_07045 [Proteus mirabilis]|nr:hypothetical protein ABE79_07045 [Proteus mirabilis]
MIKLTKSKRGEFDAFYNPLQSIFYHVVIRWYGLSDELLSAFSRANYEYIKKDVIFIVKIKFTN